MPCGISVFTPTLVVTFVISPLGQVTGALDVRAYMFRDDQLMCGRLTGFQAVFPRSH